MKKLTLLICLMFVSLLANTQNNTTTPEKPQQHRRDSLPWSERYLHQGNFMMMAKPILTFDTWKIKENKDKGSNFGLDLCPGYFPIKRLAIGPELSYTYSKYETPSSAGSTASTTKFSTSEFGLWGRGYPVIGGFNDMVAPVQPFVGADLTFGTSKSSYSSGTFSSDNNYKERHWEAYLGADLPLCCHCCALSYYIGYQSTKETNKDNSSDVQTKSGMFMGFALDIFFKNHHSCCDSPNMASLMNTR